MDFHEALNRLKRNEDRLEEDNSLHTRPQIRQVRNVYPIVLDPSMYTHDIIPDVISCLQSVTFNTYAVYSTLCPICNGTGEQGVQSGWSRG